MQSQVVDLMAYRGLDPVHERIKSTELQGPHAAMRLELRGIDLSGKSLVNVDLSGLDLSNANLSGADLTGAMLADTCLQGANMERAVLESATLRNANLAGANLTEVRATWADFAGANLTGVRALGARCVDATFGDAVLDHADFTGAHLTRAELFSARTVGTTFFCADLRAVDFEDANLADACFDEADMQAARFRSVKGWESASFVLSDVRNADFTGALLVQEHARSQSWWWEWSQRSMVHRWIGAVKRRSGFGAVSLYRPVGAAILLLMAGIALT